MSQGRAAVSSLGSQRKGGLGDRLRGLAQDELLLLIAPLVASLVGTLKSLEENSLKKEILSGHAPKRVHLF